MLRARRAADGLDRLLDVDVCGPVLCLIFAFFE